MGTTTHPADALAKFKIDGTTPFADRESTAEALLIQVHGLTNLLSRAFMDADADHHDLSTVGTSREIFTARTFEAIGSLIGVALFLQSDGVAC
ncbi:MAG TPA: hypothetical protein VHL34_24995 [Rhizomicrobium sp.]|jgi:hypothetical protein|nr:hypothetical protein [Rhizomicrobium sp.]